MALTAKQERFVEEYLIDLNATQAAIRAGYSPKGATVRGAELLANRKVAVAVQEAKDKRSERTEVTQDMVIDELRKIGFSDIREVASWGERPNLDEVEEDEDLRIYPVELTASENISDDTAAAVSEVSLTAQGVKVKMHDKLAALEKIGKHLGMFVNRVDLSNKDGTLTPKAQDEADAFARRMAGLSASDVEEGDGKPAD